MLYFGFFYIFCILYIYIYISIVPEWVAELFRTLRFRNLIGCVSQLFRNEGLRATTVGASSGLLWRRASLSCEIIMKELQRSSTVSPTRMFNENMNINRYIYNITNMSASVTLTQFGETLKFVIQSFKMKMNLKTESKHEL